MYEEKIIIHIVAAAIDAGLTPEKSAIILTLIGVANTTGRLLLGGLASRFGNKLIFVISLAVQVVALSLLVGANDLNAFYVVGIVYGLAYGGSVPLVPTLTGSFFGTRSMGSIWGTLNISYSTGAAVGPLLAGFIFDITGNYLIAFSLP